MAAGCDDLLLLSEVRRAFSALTIIERAVLNDRFGLGGQVEADSDAPLEDVTGRRWVEMRALRKLRSSGLSLRETPSDPSAPPTRRRQGSVIIPLRPPKDPSLVWPQREPFPDPQQPDNQLWDEA